jgi:hypothetical protein
VAKKAKKRAGRPRRSTRRVAKSDTNVAIIRWWENLNLRVGPTYGPHDTTVPCAAKLAVTSGSEPIYHDVTTQYGGSPFYAHVDFISFSSVFGLYVPVSLLKTATGFSFNGYTPVCIKSSVCSNGQPRVWKVYLAGELKTTGDPDVLTYQYTLDTFCGDKVSCTENGTFTGERTKGAANSFEGKFYGTHEWTTKCCASRQR